MPSVRIQLPTTCSDTRVDSVRIYRIEQNASFSRIAQLALGSVQFTDGLADFGKSYYLTFYDSVNDSESGSSPLTYVFRKATTSPGVF